MSENDVLKNEEQPEEPVMEEYPEIETSEVEVELAAGAEKNAGEPVVEKKSKWPNRSEGITIIAVYHFLISIPGLIAGCALLVFPLSAILYEGGIDAMGVIGIVFGLLVGLLFTAGLSGLSIATGIGLLKLKNWGRWLAIAQAILALVLVPVGTVIGGLIIWYLLQNNIKQEFMASA